MIINDDEWPGIVIDNDFLSEDNKNFISDTVLSNDFNYTIDHSNKNQIILQHKILKGSEEVGQYDDRVVSPYFDQFKKIFVDFLKKYPHSCKVLLKMNVDLYLPSKDKQTETKVVHENDDYRQLIVYLNSSLSRSTKTLIYKGDYTEELYNIEAVQFQGINFEKLPVCQIFPKEGSIITLTVTYK